MNGVGGKVDLTVPSHVSLKTLDCCQNVVSKSSCTTVTVVQGVGAGAAALVFIVTKSLIILVFEVCHQTGIDVPINELELVASLCWGILRP